ncbi:unnamed protein product [Schistosoma spindalis]|nr:unnamed protein product [Schistosoma spindale]
MVYISQILLVLLLIIVNTDYGLPLVCYSCTVCPKPLNPSSQTVRNLSSSKWRTNILVKSAHHKLRECAPEWDFEYWDKTYKSLEYHCNQTDYCNKSVQIHVTHRILHINVITFTCVFINKMQ